MYSLHTSQYVKRERMCNVAELFVPCMRVDESEGLTMRILFTALREDS